MNIFWGMNNVNNIYVLLLRLLVNRNEYFIFRMIHYRGNTESNPQFIHNFDFSVPIIVSRLSFGEEYFPTCSSSSQAHVTLQFPIKYGIYLN